MGSHWRQEGDPVTTPSSGHLPKTPYMEGGGGVLASPLSVGDLPSFSHSPSCSGKLSMAQRKREPGEPVDPVGDCLCWPLPSLGEPKRWVG